MLDQPPPRFLITLAGMEITRIYGADYTGRYVEEVIPPEAHAIVLEPYEHCLATGKPIFSRLSPGVLKGTFRHLDRLLLPCSDDGSRIDTIIVGVYISAFDPNRGSIFGRAISHH